MGKSLLLAGSGDDLFASDCVRCGGAAGGSRAAGVAADLYWRRGGWSMIRSSFGRRNLIPPVKQLPKPIPPTFVPSALPISGRRRFCGSGKRGGRCIMRLCGRIGGRRIFVPGSKNGMKLAEMIQRKTGLIADAYFSASKLKWLLDHVPGTFENGRRGNWRLGRWIRGCCGI